MEEDYEPTVQHQRRVNPKIHDVIKKEVEKLLDAGLIYPISDSPWVSPVHCVPKKGGSDRLSVYGGLSRVFGDLSLNAYLILDNVKTALRNTNLVLTGRKAFHGKGGIVLDTNLQVGNLRSRELKFSLSAKLPQPVYCERTVDAKIVCLVGTKLDDALWPSALQRTNNPPIGVHFSYRACNGKDVICRLRLEHKAYWALTCKLMSRIFEASRARGICPSITRASQSSASFLLHESARNQLIPEPFVLFHSRAISFLSVGLCHPLEQVREPRVNELKEPHDRIVHRLCIWMCIKKGRGRGREREEAAAAPHELLTGASGYRRYDVKSKRLDLMLRISLTLQAALLSIFCRLSACSADLRGFQSPGTACLFSAAITVSFPGSDYSIRSAA
ncbi:hypothetical protein Tco_0598034 [Tanacetum coccineum]